MDAQALLNVLYGLVSTLFAILMAVGGWIMSKAFRQLEDAEDEIKNLSLRLAEGYVPRSELQETFRQFGNKLDEINRILREGLHK